MKKALLKDSLVQISKTRKRFISILLMAFLGVGFFAGVRSASPDMRKTIDYVLDKSNAYDVRIVSTLGLTDEDVDSLKALDNTEDVKGFYSEDVYIDFEDAETVVKVLEYDKDINLLTLEEGSLPENVDECVIEDSMQTAKGVNIGDYIDIREDSSVDNEDDEINLDTDEETESDSDDDSNFINKHLKVVGIVKSPLYISRDRGTTTLGSGTVSYFIYLNKDNIKSEVYTEINLTVANADKVETFTDEYDNIIESYKDEVEKIKDERQNARYNELITKANDKLNEADEKFQTEKADAQKKIDDAEKEIADGKSEIQKNEKKLSDAEKELADGRSKAKTEFDNAQNTLNDGENKLNSAQNELNSKKSEYDSSVLTAQSGIAQIDAGITSINTTISELNNNKEMSEKILNSIKSIDEVLPTLKTQLNDIQSNLDKLAPSSNEYAQLYQTYQKVETQILDMTTKREDLIAYGITNEKLNQINDGIKEATNKKSELELQKQGIQKSLDDGKKALDDAQNQINANKTEIENGKNTLSAKIQETEQKFKDAEAEISKGKKEIKKAKTKLADGEKELADKKIEFNEKIADAEKKLIDAREKVNDIENPTWYIFDRYDNTGLNSYSQDVDNIKRIAQVFPILFFLIATLISLTTMTRMVEEERVQIGTLKALGYNNLQIMSKYIIYSLLASVVGGTLGALFGVKFFPYIIIYMYNMMYNITKIVVPYNIENSLLGILFMSICMCSATIITALKELISTPAELMRPKAPKPGKRVLLEKIPFIWKHLNFTQKVTIRNMFRYKKKFFMTVIGISGCTALVLTGFGLKDSIQKIMDYQYVNIYNYDLMIGIKNTINEDEKNSLEKELLDKEEIKDCIDVYMSSVTAKGNNYNTSTSLIVTNSTEEIEKMINLKDVKTGDKLTLNDNEIIITDKLAQLLSVKAGDKIVLEDGDKKEVTVTVGAISEHYISHNIYMTKALYNNLFNKEDSSNIIYAQYSRELTQEEENNMNKELLSNSKISSITLTSYLMNLMNDVLANMNIVVYILIISAGLLAFIVLYNLSTINISERIRELATIKVLGFYDKEVYNYVTREIILLTIIGIIFGLLLGTILDTFILKTVEIEILRFKRIITPFSFCVAALLTGIFTYIVNIMTYFSLKKINMIESLKSVE